MFWTLAMQNQIIIEKVKKPHKMDTTKGNGIYLTIVYFETISIFKSFFFIKLCYHPD